MQKREKYMYIVLSVVALLLFSLMSYIKGGSFDFDETFSFAMIEHSFSDIWVLTARDYHPPLSYYILKVLSWVIKPFSDGNVEIFRVTSILGYFSSILLCIFPIRRLFGFKVSIISILLIILMPISFYIYSNFRMYAWTMPLVLATFVYAVDSYQSNSKWAWFKLTLFTNAAMYIHYYSLISSFVIYVALFITILKSKDNFKKLLVNYLISSVLLVVLYSPWLYFFVGQLAEVRNDYWIENPALSDIVFAIQFYFVPKFYTEKYVNLLSHTWLLAVIPLLLALTVSIVLVSYRKLSNKFLLYSASASFAVLFVSLALVMIYTYAVSPVYHIRYLMCYFGLFVLGLAICISVLWDSKTGLSKILIVAFTVCLIFDFGLCMYMNITRSNFSLNKKDEREDFRNNAIKDYYCDEENFPNMAYLTVIYPDNNYYLITDDNPKTRIVAPPYIAGDTISGLPFYNFKKVRTLPLDKAFLYLIKNNPQRDTVFSSRYQVVDSIYTGLYHVEPIIQ